MDVLVLGPQGAEVDDAAQKLTAAGHGVHRCVTEESARETTRLTGTGGAHSATAATGAASATPLRKSS